MKTAEVKTFLSDDFGMASVPANQAVGDTLREITRRGPVEPYQLKQALRQIETVFIEASAPAVRDEAIQWLRDNDLLIDR
jgi:hypothetical protein